MGMAGSAISWMSSSSTDCSWRPPCRGHSRTQRSRQSGSSVDGLGTGIGLQAPRRLTFRKTAE